MNERFYCTDPPVEGLIRLEPDESHHLARVRRVEEGELVEVFDGRGHGHRARVVRVGKKQVELEVIEPLEDSRRAGLRIQLAVAVPKGERMEWLVEKATELGVDRLVPLRFERSVVDPRSSRLDRLRRRVVESAKQCGRFELMQIDEVARLEDYLGTERAETRLVAHPGGKPLAAFPAPREGGMVSVIVGPEGGLSDQELSRCLQAGWCQVGLGPTILRVETAALAAVAGLLARVGTDREQAG